MAGCMPVADSAVGTMTTRWRLGSTAGLSGCMPVTAGMPSSDAARQAAAHARP